MTSMTFTLTSKTSTRKNLEPIASILVLQLKMIRGGIGWLLNDVEAFRADDVLLGLVFGRLGLELKTTLPVLRVSVFGSFGGGLAVVLSETYFEAESVSAKRPFHAPVVALDVALMRAIYPVSLVVLHLDEDLPSEGTCVDCLEEQPSYQLHDDPDEVSNLGSKVCSRCLTHREGV